MSEFFLISHLCFSLHICFLLLFCCKQTFLVFHLHGIKCSLTTVSKFTGPLIKQAVRLWLQIFSPTQLSGDWVTLLSGTILVSQGSRKRLLSSGWLFTTELYSLTILEARTLKLKCPQSCSPSRASGEGSFPPLPAPGPPGFLGSWPHHCSLRLHCQVASTMCVKSPSAYLL